MHRQASAERGGKGFRHQVRRPPTRGNRGVVHRALFDTRHTHGDANRNIRLDAEHELKTSTDFADKVAEHRFGDHIVRDDTVAHRAHHFDIFRRASKHRLGFFTQRDQPLIGQGKRDERGFL